MSLMTQSANKLYLFLIAMSGLICSIPFCIFATTGESDRGVVHFLDKITFSFSSVAFLLATVHVDALFEGAQSRFTIASF